MISTADRNVGAALGGYAADAAQLVALALLFPVAILAIGTPFALAIRVLVEVGRKLLGH
jgi:hypothetical protein